MVDTSIQITMSELEEKLVKGEKIPGILKVDDQARMQETMSEPKMASVVRPWAK